MSANRDERVFAEPFRFDVTRTPNLHLGFGFGAHVCLGASLARMEMRVAFQELLSRIETFAPEGAIDWMPSNRLLGIRRMPISIRKRATISRGTLGSTSAPPTARLPGSIRTARPSRCRTRRTSRRRHR